MDRIIRDILRANGIFEDFAEMSSTGLANRIYATDNFVLRIPTDHAEALNDARTEAIAAPLVKRHGITTPALIAYDDSRALIDRSYSIWERVQGFSLDNADDGYSLNGVWVKLGNELGLLHTGIKNCPDPDGWLDSPDREYVRDDLVRTVTEKYGGSDGLRELIDRACDGDTFAYEKRFVHGDVHTGNIMCSPARGYAGLIDWGDAGWADPAIDFYMIPVRVIGLVLSGYAEATDTAIVDEGFINRIMLDKIWMLAESGADAGVVREMVESIRKEIRKGIRRLP
jgi:aminoglycoside phosphotransferase (APT) family kinase protein